MMTGTSDPQPDGTPLLESRAETLRALRAHKTQLIRELRDVNMAITAFSEENRAPAPERRTVKPWGIYGRIRAWMAAHPGQQIGITGMYEYLLSTGWRTGGREADRRKNIASAMAHLATWGEWDRVSTGRYEAPETGDGASAGP